MCVISIADDTSPRKKTKIEEALERAYCYSLFCRHDNVRNFVTFSNKDLPAVNILSGRIEYPESIPFLHCRDCSL